MIKITSQSKIFLIEILKKETAGTQKMDISHFNRYCQNSHENSHTGLHCIPHCKRIQVSPVSSEHIIKCKLIFNRIYFYKKSNLIVLISLNTNEAKQILMCLIEELDLCELYFHILCSCIIGYFCFTYELVKLFIYCSYSFLYCRCCKYFNVILICH